MSAWIEPSQDEVTSIVRGARFVAVVGLKADGDPGPGHTVPEHMKARGIRIVGVNPTIREALGAPALASVADLREAPDVLQVFRRSEHVSALADEVLALPSATRPKVVWLQSGIVDARAAERLEAAGIRVVMDRCFAVEMAKVGR